MAGKKSSRRILSESRFPHSASVFFGMKLRRQVFVTVGSMISRLPPRFRDNMIRDDDYSRALRAR